jgi:predicted phosphodiesterase
MSSSTARLLSVGACLLVFGLAFAFRPQAVQPVEAADDTPKSADSPSFLIAPYLQFATRTSITVMWETDVPATSEVAYGTTVPVAEKAVAKEMTTIHEVALTGLRPNTKYWYQAASTTADGKVLTGKLLTFATAVDDDSAFSFAVIGDTQKNPKVTGKIAKLMYDRRPNFAIHCGDVVDNGPDKKEWVHELFGPAQELFGRVALFPCIGNHEKNHAYYYQYFSLPAPEYYYKYRYGNAEFFVLDTNKRASLKPGGEQFTWLDRELAKSVAKWKFAYHHHPAYSSDSDDYGNTITGKGPFTLGDPNVQNNLVQLYEKYNVDVVFNGHIHLYERTWPLRGGKVDRKSGVVYVTSGGGGGTLEDFGPTPTWFKAETRVDFHFCYVTIQGGEFHLKAFDQEGRLFDYLDLQK